MNTQEQARSMLADEFEASGHNKIAADVRRGPMPGHSTPLWMDEALRAIEKALTLSSTPSPSADVETRRHSLYCALVSQLAVSRDANKLLDVIEKQGWQPAALTAPVEGS